MALLFMDGFDHYGTSDPALAGIQKWSVSAGSPSCNTTLPRTGTHALRLPSTSATLTTKPLPAGVGFVVGGAYQASAIFAATDLIQVLELSTVHMALAITTGGLLTVKRGSTVLATGTKVLVPNNWYYLEFKAVIHDTTGSYEVKIDGVTEAPLTNAGPTDTRNAGTTGQWDRVLLGAGSATANWDDVYICDHSLGAPRDTFLGPVKAEPLFPQTDAVAAGTNAGLTPSTGLDHGALVDETSPNTTDYNSSGTVGVKDTYQYPPMTLTGTIFGIQANLYVQKADSMVRSVCAVVRSGTTDYDGAAINPLTSWAYHPTVFPKNPDTSAEWTIADIAALQVGMKITV